MADGKISQADLEMLTVTDDVDEVVEIMVAAQKSRVIRPMMWFFAILLVLLMGGIAMVAAGRGTPMAAAYDDRPDALVPGRRPARRRRRPPGPVLAGLPRLPDVRGGRAAGPAGGQLERAEWPPEQAGADADTAGQGEVADPPAVREARSDDPAQ